MHEFAAGGNVTLSWRNIRGGLTFQFADRFIKWNPRSTGIDLDHERQRLEWIAPRHRAPRVVEFGQDDASQWLITIALPGAGAVGDHWRARSRDAIRAIAKGLQAIHSVAIDEFPPEWAAQGWVAQRPESLGTPPLVDKTVLVHGDACAPNTLINDVGEWVGHVDFGDLTVGDRWADLAIASMSLDRNFGEGHQHELFEAYGIEPDQERIRYYRGLYRLAS